MASFIRLEGEGGSLLIEAAVNEYQWTRCQLLAARQVYLGADVLSCVVSGLRKALTVAGTDDAASSIDGQIVRSAMLLSEAHHALYVAVGQHSRTLFWQDAASSSLPVVGTIRLTPTQCRRWTEQLMELESRYLRESDSPRPVAEAEQAATR